MLYAADAAWWDHHRGAAAFAGEKWTQVHRAPAAGGKIRIDDGHARRWGLRPVLLHPDLGMSNDPAVIGSGKNSGHQALNILALRGCRRVLLLGFDMRLVAGQRHFFGDHPGRLNKQSKYHEFVAAFGNAVPVLEAMNVEVWNGTPGSALTCFPAVPLREALKRCR